MSAESFEKLVRGEITAEEYCDGIRQEVREGREPLTRHLPSPRLCPRYNWLEWTGQTVMGIVIAMFAVGGVVTGTLPSFTALTAAVAAFMLIRSAWLLK